TSDVPARRPKRLASYEHDAMTPLPTATGRPRKRGSRACSTDAKNASMSRWSTGSADGADATGTGTGASAIEHHRRDAPRELVGVQAQLVDVARLDRAGEVMQRLEPDAV